VSWASSYVAIDCETTGFGPNARILEIAAVTFENGAPVREYSQLLYPENVDWESEGVRGALEVNHITRAELEGKPRFADILPDLMMELAHHVWVAHNFSFDFEQTQNEFRRAGHDLEPPPLTICTCRLAAYLSPMVKGNKLYQVAARYGVPQESAHRAAVDARVCGFLLDRMNKQGKLPADDMAMKDLVMRANNAWKGRR
jgi:DNA polymerase III subunit epsilon